MTLAHWQRRRLRLGMVGGGIGGNIGSAHRTAALMDGRWDVVAGVLSRDAVRGRQSAALWQIDPARSYETVETMAAAEKAREDGIDAVAICTPNADHYPSAMAFLKAGIHVICDKPLTTVVALADELAATARAKNVIFAVTHTYSGYPMVRAAREMIAAARLGTIRSVAVEYASEYQVEGAEGWQNDPQLSGPLGIVAGTGTHAHHLAEFVTGLRVRQLSADLSTLVPGNRLEDHASMHLRFSNGARGYLWNTTLAPGNANGLSIRVYGDKGGIAWHQERPETLAFTPTRGVTRLITRGSEEAGDAAGRVTRVPAGHPEGYLEAFANLYCGIADAIAAHQDGTLSGTFDFPTVEDGARGVRFMHAALRSARDGSRFVPLEDS
ncbi:Gfo/Idh/MocA family oxidoreductase [Rhizobium grahamii]|uniref:Gfo/Idh/MocA family oxidoreductase n=1 Tax=Rhizobium grahamii TaxID=1120045 RepID=A0A5Q0C964_9HYPH|nr:MULTISPECIES: Gfo/Idh/MocA family oxidoreductase [Rhizobium]QFY60477.1 Gfo/Idh/MocA family oxidoreductase [Rhizobium grahamii]QRM50395.1 Gfo/Idh/MocA family oxidoreductase [Rhizobium sp. BG6]